ncbi:MAG: flavin monoamine oxidase family protein [Solirubrobacteraceae bacterium]|nr:MAG: hypothetical protein DLM63_02510 [Solirubrobacterales bacterium]
MRKTPPKKAIFLRHRRRCPDPAADASGLTRRTTILLDLNTVVSELDSMATSVPIDAPWTTPRAAALDSQSLETWLESKTQNPRLLVLASVATRAIFGAEPREVSLLFTLFYVAAAGDEKTPGTFERLFNTRNGAQMFRFVGGSQTIPLRMASALGPRVLLNQPVRSVTQTAAGVRVATDSSTVSAARAIVAVPPTLAVRIVYDPPLPPLRDQLTQRVFQGSLIKAEAVYDTPFWRAQGYTGTSIADTTPANTTFDNSRRKDRPGYSSASSAATPGGLPAALRRQPTPGGAQELRHLPRFPGAHPA